MKHLLPFFWFFLIIFCYNPQDCHVHAFVYADKWRSVADKIDEGCVYVISNFYTKKPTGNLKPVSSPVLINFSNSTSVEKVEEDDFMIPRHKFEFVDFSDMLTIASANKNVEYPEFTTGLYLIKTTFIFFLLLAVTYILHAETSVQDHG